MAKLTSRQCENAKPPANASAGWEKMLSDGDGLYLRTLAGGGKSWVVEFELNGKRTKRTIGNYDVNGCKAETIDDLLDDGLLSLAQARNIAASWKQTRRAGRDPVIQWDSRIAAKNAAISAEAALPTLLEATQRYMTQFMDGKKSSCHILYRLERLSAEIGADMKIHDITHHDVVKAIENIAAGKKRGKTAKQLAGEVLVTAQRLWAFAESRQWVQENCISRLTRANFDAQPKKRELALRFDEVVELWKGLDDPKRCKSDYITISAIKILVLTGQRENEVCGAEWNEFDIKAGLWKIPATRTKMNRQHLVHLAPQAIRILTAIKMLTGGKKHVFNSPLKDGQPIWGRSTNNALLTMFKRGVLHNVTPCHIHDLRHTLITRLPDLGFELHIGHKIANHKMTGMMEIYNHNEYLEKREEALLKWAARIEELASGSNVVHLQAKVA